MEPVGCNGAVEERLLWGFLYVRDVGKNYGEGEKELIAALHAV